MYQALYRKYRPVDLDDAVGQKVIIQTLKNTILNDKISHAYLFSGPRGTGKTSLAKVLSKIVNCENLEGVTPCNKCVSCTQTNNKQNTDIVEIDAASNNGVDEIRDLRDKVSLVPSYGKYKIYIIDEVHMLTQQAFNALLKTLEEPPKHIIFILATTEPHKIPATILSRCQRFDFNKISVADITKRIKYIIKKENIDIEEDAIELIAKLSDGGMRDSISLLDQLTAYASNKITIDDVNEVYGTIKEAEIYNLIDKLSNSSINESFKMLSKYDDDGKNLVKILELSIEFLKNCLIFMSDSSYFDNEDSKKLYKNICDILTEDQIYSIIEIFMDTIKSSKNTNNIKLLMELSFIKIIKILNISQKAELKNEIPILEDKKIIKVDKKIKVKQTNAETKNQLEQLKQIRINNTLARFNKTDLSSFKKELYKLEELIMNPDYSSIASLITDGELKAKGEENLLFVYKLKNLEEYFNQSLLEVEKVLNKSFDKNYKPIAVCEEEWNKIKEDFNKNLKFKTKVYQYQKEDISLEDLQIKEEEKNNAESNEIENMFEEIIEYN